MKVAGLLQGNPATKRHDEVKIITSSTRNPLNNPTEPASPARRHRPDKHRTCRGGPTEQGRDLAAMPRRTSGTDEKRTARIETLLDLPERGGKEGGARTWPRVAAQYCKARLSRPLGGKDGAGYSVSQARQTKRKGRCR